MGLGEVSDYQTYDFAEVASLTAWTALSAAAAAMAFIGSAVIAGISWRMRNPEPSVATRPDGKPATAADEVPR